MEDFAKAEMPTADTCGECHKKQTNQHRAGKHNLGWLVMKSQIAWHGQPGAITERVTAVVPAVTRSAKRA